MLINRIVLITRSLLSERIKVEHHSSQLELNPAGRHCRVKFIRRADTRSASS